MMSLRWMTSCALVLALGVLMLGAYTRLSDAGLGCPDWPGCYGHMVLPAAKPALQAAQHRFPDVPLEGRKAWTEMSHRYAAGILALFILVLAFVSFKKRAQHVPYYVPFFLLFLLLGQALLGMWTVTLKLLPLVVMGHLLGGMLIFSGLCCFRLQLGRLGRSQTKNLSRATSWRKGIVLGLVLVFLQIALGAWVSANYAGLACIGFPQCNGQWWPALHFPHGLHLLAPVGANYQGGVLDNDVRMSIQFVHRLGALVVFSYLMLFVFYLIEHARTLHFRFAVFVLLFLLGLQFTLGVINVTQLLPLWSAVLHNGVAALLLAALLMLYFFAEDEVADA